MVLPLPRASGVAQVVRPLLAGGASAKSTVIRLELERQGAGKEASPKMKKRRVLLQID
jgi:hypothetical protein